MQIIDSYLYSGQQLLPNEFITSADHNYCLTFQSDGTLALYDKKSSNCRVLFHDAKATYAFMQPDGSLVVRDKDNRNLWALWGSRPAAERVGAHINLVGGELEFVYGAQDAPHC